MELQLTLIKHSLHLYFLDFLFPICWLPIASFHCKFQFIFVAVGRFAYFLLPVFFVFFLLDIVLEIVGLFNATFTVRSTLIISCANSKFILGEIKPKNMLISWLVQLIILFCIVFQ
ncbi:hypothetical protein M6B38_353635 [Iris pallida]|uniref:Uncharacterized protein n=1 Tax=Iris pallida TaxID=29817 RepID=A0AAX6GNE3_IRIPA|nr:hypothetical protein M6B38_353635 [Iris pallida]